MANDIWYSIKSNRIKSGCMRGFVEEDNMLKMDVTSAEHSLFLRALDGVVDEALWGRLSCNLFVSDEIVCYIYIVASDSLQIVDDEGNEIRLDDILCDPEGDTYRKVTLMQRLGAKRFANTSDILLYELKGRYLFIAMEMLGAGYGEIGNMRVGVRGDNFMNAFPQVYRERNGFFHRYMSVFSSIYNDISDRNEKLYEMLDLDKCSTDLLVMYGSWFGIDLQGNFLPEDVLRSVVKEAYSLNRIKGTKKAMERILELFLGDDVVILENRFQDGGIFEVTVLVNRKLTEELRHQIMFLLDQFKPLRTQVRILQMEKDAIMDGNSYLDMNATIPASKHLVLDEESMYDGTITLI